MPGVFPRGLHQHRPIRRCTRKLMDNRIEVGTVVPIEISQDGTKMVVESVELIKLRWIIRVGGRISEKNGRSWNQLVLDRWVKLYVRKALDASPLLRVSYLVRWTTCLFLGPTQIERSVCRRSMSVCPNLDDLRGPMLRHFARLRTLHLVAAFPIGLGGTSDSRSHCSRGIERQRRSRRKASRDHR